MKTTRAALARIARADSTTWGQALETAARPTAAVLVAVYVAGLTLGAWVHRISGALGAMASRPHRPSPRQRRAGAPAARRSHRPAPMPAKPSQTPAGGLQAAPEALEVLTVHQLRQLARRAGHRGLARNGRRSALLQVLGA